MLEHFLTWSTALWHQTYFCHQLDSSVMHVNYERDCGPIQGPRQAPTIDSRVRVNVLIVLSEFKKKK